MSLPFPGKDRTCLVTGASSGIGVEIARELASRGYGVTLLARREEALRKVAEELHKAHGVRAEALAADLTDPAARRALPGRVAELGLEVDVLVNNAGFGHMGLVVDADEEREVALIQTNVEALVSLCSLFVPAMVERRRGAVLNVASTAAFQPMPGSANYAASKAFVWSYSEALRGEVSGHGVSVSVLCPGPVPTEFNDVAGIDDERAGTVPKFMWRSAAAVARAGVDGLAGNHAVVVPGFPNKFAATLAHHVPNRIVVPLIKRLNPYA
jgi:short-subunit dehydrogenase